MDDLSYSSNSVKCTMFDDDTALCVRDPDYRNLMRRAGDSVNLLYNWTIQNKTVFKSY